MRYFMSVYLACFRTYEKSNFWIYLIKTENVQLFVSPKPLEVYTLTIRHLKALINGFLDLEELRCGSIFTLCHADTYTMFYTINWPRCLIHFRKLYTAGSVCDRQNHYCTENLYILQNSVGQSMRERNFKCHICGESLFERVAGTSQGWVLEQAYF